MLNYVTLLKSMEYELIGFLDKLYTHIKSCTINNLHIIQAKIYIFNSKLINAFQNKIDTP